MLPPLLQSYKNAGLIMCLYAFKNGSWLDLSGNNLTLSPQNRARLGPDGLVLVTNGSSSDSATATNTSALDVANTQAVAFFCKHRANGLSEGDYPPIFSSRPWTTGTDAGLAFGVEGKSATRINVHFANGTSGLDVPTARSSLNSVGLGRWYKTTTFVNQLTEKKISFYINHIKDANEFDMSAFAPIAVDTSTDLNIGRDVNGGGSRRFNGSIEYLAVLKQTTDFTATQEAQIHAELESMVAQQAPLITQKQNFTIPDQTTGLVSQFVLTSNGVWDTTKAEKCTVGSNISTTQNKILGNSFDGLSTGSSGTRIAGASNSGISGAAAVSMDFWVSGITSTSRMALGSIGTNSNGAAFGLELSTATANGCLYLVGFNRDAATTARPINDGGLHHVGVTYDGATTVKFYVDGVEAAATAALSSALSITNSPFHVGQAVYDSAYGVRGSIHVGRLWNKTLSAAEVKAIYERAKPAMSYRFGYGLKASGATAEGGVTGAFLSNSPFRFGESSGRFKIGSELVNGVPCKTLTCSTAGFVYADITAITSNPGNLTGFGEWTVWFYKGAGANTLIVSLASKDAALYSTTGNQTYSFAADSTENYHLFRGNGAAAGTTLTLSGNDYIANTTWYRIRVSRDVLGVFRSYILGGVYKTETLVTASGGSNPTSADRTYFAGNYVVVDMDAGDKIVLASVDGSMGLHHKLIA